MNREPGTVRLLQISGVPVFVHWSVLAGAALLSFFVKFDLSSTLVLWHVYVFLIALHEAAHAIAARSLGLQVFSVSISGFGGLCRFQSPTSYGTAFFIISAGLVVQTALLVSAVVYIAVIGVPSSTYGSYMAVSFIYVNGAVIVLNLIPEKPRRSHFGTDGYLLWKLALNALRRRPFAMPDTSATFPSRTRLADLKGFRPDGFQTGIEILNDNTTPMEFVVNTLVTHMCVSRDEAIKMMLNIHTKGGLIIPLPTHERAVAVARGIANDASANGHKLVCRAVGAQPAVPADGLAPLGNRLTMKLDTMHYTLTPRGNIALMALMALVLLLCLFTGSGASMGAIAVFSIAGLLAGLLQARSIYSHRSKFLSARSALQVRAALTSSISGKVSVALLWLAGFALIALLIRGGEYATVQTLVGSYATFSLAREIAALPALFALRSWSRSA